MNIEHIILGPVLTEKSTNMTKSNVYMFEVAPDANKYQISQALESVYKVKVGSVRVLTRQGKMRRVGRKWQYKQLPETKIAYVKLTQGKIDLFPQA